MADSHSDGDTTKESYKYTISNSIELMEGDSIIRQALMANNLEPSAQIKVNELLYHWLSLPQTRYLVNDLAHECVIKSQNNKSKMIIDNEVNMAGVEHDLSATHGAMELEVKESEKRPSHYQRDERSILEKQSLRKAAVAAASCDSHPPLSPCNSPDAPRYEKVPTVSGTRRNKKAIGNKSSPSSSPSSTVKTKNVTNEIETKESPSSEHVVTRNSELTDRSIPRFYFPNNQRAQHQHTIEARRRSRIRRRAHSTVSNGNNEIEKVNNNESKMGQSGDSERKLAKLDASLNEGENESEDDEKMFVKYLPEIRSDLLVLFDPGKDENNDGISLDDFAQVTKEFCGFPSFFAEPLAIRVHEIWNEKLGNKCDINKRTDDLRITFKQFEYFWVQEMEPYDRFQRFFRLIKQQKNDRIFPEDFEPFLNELLTFHPGLEFLHDTHEFQEKYKRTVVARIMYVADSFRRGHITVKNLRKAEPCILSAFDLVDEEEDINIVHDYFSYEHFYVLYCRFWELDVDHDFLLCKDDLLPYGCHALTCGIIDRYFQQPLYPFIGKSYKTAREGEKDKSQKNLMGYEDFVYFMLNEEDKSTANALRTWFACVDLDGDGVIRPHEMKQFYAEQLHRMECLGQEIVPFEDVLCQMTDHIEPKVEGEVRISDLLNAEKQPSAGIFFNVLFNLNKFIAFEQRDPFQMKQMQAGNKISCWARFAGMEYARLAMEEEYKVQDITSMGNVHVDVNQNMEI